jgi:hypothetical protein
MDLAECSENLGVGCSKRIAVDGSGGHQRGCHIPVAQHHPEGCVASSAHQSQHLVKAVGTEVSRKPRPRFPQHRFPAQVEEL